jgi:hypothetical protein
MFLKQFVVCWIRQLMLKEIKKVNLVPIYHVMFFFLSPLKEGCLAGLVQTSVKKGVEESVAWPCQLRFCSVIRDTVYACRLNTESQDLKTQTCRLNTELRTAREPWYFSWSLPLHSGRLLHYLSTVDWIKSALHHVWSKFSAWKA